jgi:hypothetical protein
MTHAHNRTCFCDAVFNVQRIFSFPTTVSYLLTPWSRVLLEKLTGLAASQEFPRIYGTRKFITVLTSAHHLPPPEPAPSSPHNPSHFLKILLILSSHLRLGLPNGLVPSGFRVFLLHRLIFVSNSGKFSLNASQIYYQNVIERGLDEILDAKCRLLLSVY